MITEFSSRSLLRWAARTMTRMRQILVPALLVVLAPILAAQRIGPAHFGATSFHAGHFSPRAFRRGYFPLGLYSPYYDDDFSDAGYPVSARPQVIVLQSPQPAPVADPTPTSSQPLMIELQGDRYVQISGDQSSRSELIDSDRTKLVTRSINPASSNAISPAVLIFRDGHRAEVSAYTIAGGALYASSDYATTGSWNQKIELSALNLPETIAANTSSSHPFRIPTSPNEVIVGP
jgi:hypothetical protein